MFLEKHHAGEQVLIRINDKLKKVGLMFRHGVIIDATIISAPCSIKNKSRQRDPEMHQTRKGNQWYCDMKAHITIDAATGLTEKMVTTAANEHNLNAADILITAPVDVVGKRLFVRYTMSSAVCAASKWCRNRHFSAPVSLH